MTTVVFDVGNVLIDWDPKRVYRGCFRGDAEIEEFFDDIGFYAWNIEQDRGGGWADAVAAHSALHPEHADLIARFDRDWQQSVSGAIAGTVAILERLKAAQVALSAITNFSAEKWTEVCGRFPFLSNSFRDIVVSAHEGLVKPDPAIFELFLDRNGVAAGDCTFIDDSPANAASAAALGFDVILFETPEALGVALRGRGLPA